MRCSRDNSSGAGGWILGAALLALAACGSSNAHVVPDAAATPDAAVGPALTLQVSPSGNDADDGVSHPLETIKRAIAIATANPRVTNIVLASGSYTMSAREAFPYTVPPNVVGISGPDGGGAILEGTGAEPGLILSGGLLQNLELDNFTVAIEGAGALRITNLRIASSMIAIDVADAAKLTIDNLDITGGAVGSGICATGIKLDGAADLTVTTWTTHNLGTALDASSFASLDSGVIDIAQANITSDLGMAACQLAVFELRSGAFTLSDTLIEGGFVGIDFIQSNDTPLTITNTILRDLNFGLMGGDAVVRIATSSITDNVTAIEAAGRWSLTNVTISRNIDGIELDSEGGGVATLMMRDCTVTSNVDGGIALQGTADADLGTSADPGNNLFASNTPVNLNLGAVTPGQHHANAVGNTWTPNVQGADSLGHYSTVDTVTGPITSSFGDNFSIASNWILQR